MSLVAPIAANDFDQPGAFTIGWTDISFQAPSTTTIQGRIYYPALAAGQDAQVDPSEGPFKLVGMIQGANGAPDFYDELCTHVASWGFVVASIRGGSASAQFLGAWTGELLIWMDAQNTVPGAMFEGMVAPAPWAAMGHSRGGAALSFLVKNETRVRAIMGFEAADRRLDAETRKTFRDYDGSVLAVAGDNDNVTPPSIVFSWYRRPQLTPRKTYQEIVGGGHRGPVDLDLTPTEEDPLSNVEQQRIHFKLAVAFLVAEFVGQENAWNDILGQGGTSEPLVGKSNLEEPALWVGPFTTASTFSVGLGGSALDYGVLAASPRPASIATAFGTLGLDPVGLAVVGQMGPLGTTATLEINIPTLALTGLDVWLQGISLRTPGGKLTRSVSVRVP